jgi:hypothetical protein
MHLGTVSVNGANRVPLPAAKTTAFISTYNSN